MLHYPGSRWLSLALPAGSLEYSSASIVAINMVSRDVESRKNAVFWGGTVHRPEENAINTHVQDFC